MAKIIQDILPSIFNFDDWRIKLLQNWDTIVGDLRFKMKLEKIQENTVFIGVYETCWMQELYMLSKFIVKTINSKLGESYIKDIRFKLASEKSEKGQDLPKKKFRLTKNLELTSDQKKALKSIEDEQLQDALISFFNSCS